MHNIIKTLKQLNKETEDPNGRINNKRKGWQKREGAEEKSGGKKNRKVEVEDINEAMAQERKKRRNERKKGRNERSEEKGGQ